MIVRMQPDPSMKRFLDEVKRLPVPTKAEETALILLAQRGNIEAARTLCAQNARFLIRVANQFRGAMPMEDMINEGAVGMMKAIQRFNPSTNLRFLSYAVWWIRQAILIAAAETGRTIRISSEHNMSLRRLRKAPIRQVIGGSYLEDLTDESIRSKIKPENLILSLGASRGGLSLDKPVTEGGATPSEIIPCPNPQPYQNTESRERIDILNRLRGKLPPQQREVVTLFFGLDGREPMTLREVGIRLNLSHERIRQIKEEALKTMRILARKYTRE